MIDYRLILSAAVVMCAIASPPRHMTYGCAETVSVQAGATDEITLRVKGQGATQAAAKEDATRQGLMQAVGMFVDVQQITDGEQLVKDRILGATSALVLGSKVVAGPTRLGDGTYEVESDVRIRRRTLVGALTDAGFAVTGGIDGDSAVRAAEANFRSAKEAETLLAERLSNLWSKLLVGRLLDDNGVPLGEGELPTVVKRDDGTVVVCANVQIYFHLEAFYTKFVPELQPLLEAVAKGRGQLTSNRSTSETLSSRFGSVRSRPVARQGEPAQGDTSAVNWSAPSDGSAADGTANVIVSVGRDATALTEQFEAFRLPKALAATLAKSASEVGRGRIRLELLSSDGSVVTSKVFMPSFAIVAHANYSVVGYGTVNPFAGGQDDGLSDALVTPVSKASLRQVVPALMRAGRWQPGLGTTLISPAFLLCGMNSIPEHWTDAIELRVELTMSPSDLEGVTAYRITAVEAAPPAPEMQQLPVR